MRATKGGQGGRLCAACKSGSGGNPCYRVVNREGRVSEAFAFGGENRQIGLLEADGIEVKDGCVDLSKYQWRKEIF